MREIKFRAWDRENRTMITTGVDFGLAFLLKPANDLPADDFIGYGEKFARYFDVMQFTGLSDKYGKEIYEGDILGWMCGGVGQGDGTPAKSEVYFDRYKFAVRTGRTSFGWKLSQAAEVIGNIHENPELLEDK